MVYQIRRNRKKQKTKKQQDKTKQKQKTKKTPPHEMLGTLYRATPPTHPFFGHLSVNAIGMGYFILYTWAPHVNTYTHLSPKYLRSGEIAT